MHKSEPFKDKRCLLYIRTQCIPQSTFMIVFYAVLLRMRNGSEKF
jgi:hypothetical protein